MHCTHNQRREGQLIAQSADGASVAGRLVCAESSWVDSRYHPSGSACCWGDVCAGGRGSPGS